MAITYAQLNDKAAHMHARTHLARPVRFALFFFELEINEHKWTCRRPFFLPFHEIADSRFCVYSLSFHFISDAFIFGAFDGAMVCSTVSFGDYFQLYEHHYRLKIANKFSVNAWKLARLVIDTRTTVAFGRIRDLIWPPAGTPCAYNDTKRQWQNALKSASNQKAIESLDAISR